MNEQQGRYWTITVGLYPGILFGYRAYQEEGFTTYVIYLPFVDFALEIEH
jgi:hypothetical protein